MSSPLNRRLAAVAFFAFFAVLARSNPASADEVDRCVAASEKGQKDRRAGSLVDARAAFLRCASETCPAVVKKTCAQWVDEVTEALPTIIVAVTDPERNDIVDARIRVDDKPIAIGRAVSLDPGPHTIAVEADGFQPVTQSIVAREADHNRQISLSMARKAATQARREPPPSEPKRIRPITWVTGGLAAGALLGFAGFGIRGRVLAADLRDHCAPNCATSDRDRAHTSYVIADISLITALVFAGVSAITYFTSRD